MKKVLLFFILIGMPTLNWAADNTNYGAADYLRQGAGARASGMGGAFVAVADDATAGYWNPAGLSQMDLYVYQACLQYAILPNDASLSFLSYAFLVPNVGNFSIAWMNFSIGAIDTNDENAEFLGHFSNSENTVFVSYGRKVYGLVPGLSLGASLKFLHQGYEGYSAMGPGLDLGVLWQPILYWDHMVGLNVQNLSQHLYANGGGVESSLINAKLGAAFKFLRSEDVLYFNHLIQTVDLEVSEHSHFNIRIGAEYWYTQTLGVRAGYTGQEMTAGLSYRPENFEIDYAYHYDLGGLSVHQHRLSLLLRFSDAPTTPPAKSSLLAAAFPQVKEMTSMEEPAYKPDVQRESDVPSEKIMADILEVQRLGGRPVKIILNKGADQGIRCGFYGSVVGHHGKILMAFVIVKVDPKLSLAEVNSIARDIDEDAKAVIRKPLEK
jgi:hypothetical protein